MRQLCVYRYYRLFGCVYLLEYPEYHELYDADCTLRLTGFECIIQAVHEVRYKFILYIFWGDTLFK